MEEEVPCPFLGLSKTKRIENQPRSMQRRDTVLLRKSIIMMLLAACISCDSMDGNQIVMRMRHPILAGEASTIRELRSEDQCREVDHVTLYTQ